MTTDVVLTGTGVPHATPGRAGAGTLVRSDGIALQFDAGRATLLRLVEAGVRAGALDALFVTHVHSDHLTGLADVALTRWAEGTESPSGPLPVVAPDGPPARFVRRMLEPYDDDVAVRIAHVQPGPPEVALTTFRPGHTPTEVWADPGGTVRVRAVAVHHEPVEPAVAYRVDTPDGSVVVSGDTVVCDEVAGLAEGADVLVHEACRAGALADAVAGTPFETIFGYHADTVALGAMAARAGVGHLVLTHLIPPPSGPDAEAAFEEDVCRGGYTGPVTVGRDLTVVPVGRAG